MRPCFALVAAFLAAPLSAADRSLDGRGAACLKEAARQPHTVFEVLVSSYPTVIERRMNIKEINLMREVDPPPKTLAHGLSVADYRLDYTTKCEATCWQPGGHACAWLGGVVVDLTPESIRIYIPKEYRASSCEEKQLLLHEMEHERLDREELQKTAEKMRAALARARNLPGPLAPMNAANPEEAFSHLKLLVDKIVRPIYVDFLRTIKAKQAALDDDEAYRRLGESCSGWKRT